MANCTKNEELKAVFTERLVDLMRRTNTSNAEIEQAMDICQATFQNVVAGKTMPSVDFVTKCADFFSVSVDYLLGRCDTEGRQGNYDFEEIRLESYERYLRHKKTEAALKKSMSLEYESPWPYNLAEAILGETFPCVMTWDQKEGLREASKHLTEREQEFVWLYYKCGYTLEEIGEKYSLVRERVRQILAKGVRKMRHSRLANMVRYGYSGMMARGENERLEKENQYLEERNKYLRARIEENTRLANDLSMELEEQVKCPVVDLPTLDIPIMELDLSVRAYNCLHRAGCKTVGDIVNRCKNHPYGLDDIRNLGRHTKAEIEERLLGFGIDISKIHFEPEEAENRKELA